MSIACLAGCGRVRFSRGLCPNCRHKLRKAIKAGFTTEALEMAAGRLLPNRTHEGLKKTLDFLYPGKDRA